MWICWESVRSRGRARETEQKGGSRGSWPPPIPLPRSFLSGSVLLGLAERGQDLELLFCCVVGRQASRQPLAFRGALGGPRAWLLWERGHAVMRWRGCGL